MKTLLSMQSASVVGRPRGRHVYLIGRRFDPWKEWKGPNPPMPLRRICNIGVEFAMRPPVVNGERVTGVGSQGAPRMLNPQSFDFKWIDVCGLSTEDTDDMFAESKHIRDASA